jgi:hypothetical protein
MIEKDIFRRNRGIGLQIENQMPILLLTGFERGQGVTDHLIKAIIHVCLF